MDAFELLGVPRRLEVSEGELRAAFREAGKRVHPDAGGCEAEFAKLFSERAKAANLPYTAADVQAGTSYTAWQILETAVTANKSLDDKVLAKWLNTNTVDAITGKLRFNEIGNYGDDLSKVKQVQDGRWVVVWPKEAATPGAKLVTR